MKDDFNTNDDLEQRIKKLEREKAEFEGKFLLLNQNFGIDNSLSESLFQGIIDKLNEKVFVVDQQYCLVIFNKAFHDTMHLAGVKEIKKGSTVLSEIFPNDILELWKQSYDRALRGETLEIESSIMTTNGVVYLKNQLSPFADPEGKILGVIVISYNITAKKLSDYKLIETQLENTPDIIVRFDKNFRFVFVNAAAAAEIGIDAGKITGKSIYEIPIISPDIISRAEQIINQVFTTKQSISFESLVNTANGPQYFLSKGIPEFDYDGSIKYALFVLHKITERLKAENNLQETALRLNSIITSVSNGITLSNRSGFFEIYNPAMQEITGYSKEEANSAGIFLEKLYPDINVRKKVAEDINDLRRKKRANNVETIIQTKNGEKKYLLVASTIFEYNKEEFFLSAYQDITERKRAEQALSESERKYRHLIEGSPNIVYSISDKRGGIYYSTRTEEILGFSVSYLYEHPFVWYELILPDDLAICKSAMDKALEGQDYAIEYRIKDINNNWHWFYDRSIDIHKDKDETILEGIAIDITKLKETEENLKELNITKDKFFSIIAHDLINPFTSIIGLSDLLLLNFNRYDKDKFFKYINDINSTAKSTYNLLDNLLEWSRSQRGMTQYLPEICYLSVLVQEVIVQVIKLAEIKNIDISYSISNELTVFVDQNMIDTVLRNLLTNAVKFTNNGGKIEINAIDKDDFTEISVKDNGVGMKKSTLNKLFKIEENISSEGTESEKGTGLGLILCKEFVEKHGGEIWVESKPGKGSEFKFTIPKNTVSRFNNLKI